MLSLAVGEAVLVTLDETGERQIGVIESEAINDTRGRWFFVNTEFDTPLVHESHLERIAQ